MTGNGDAALEQDFGLPVAVGRAVDVGEDDRRPMQQRRQWLGGRFGERDHRFEVALGVGPVAPLVAGLAEPKPAPDVELGGRGGSLDDLAEQPVRPLPLTIVQRQQRLVIAQPGPLGVRQHSREVRYGAHQGLAFLGRMLLAGAVEGLEQDLKPLVRVGPDGVETEIDARPGGGGCASPSSPEKCSRRRRLMVRKAGRRSGADHSSSR